MVSTLIRLFWLTILLQGGPLSAKAARKVSAFSVIPQQPRRRHHLNTEDELSTTTVLRYSLGLEPTPGIVVTTKPEEEGILHPWEDVDEQDRKKGRRRRRWFFRRLRQAQEEDDNCETITDQDDITSSILLPTEHECSSLAASSKAVLKVTTQPPHVIGTKSRFVEDELQLNEQAVASTAVATLERPQDNTTTSRWSSQHIQGAATLWELSPEETASLQTLRDNLEDIKHPKNDPYEVARFLKEYGDVSVVERNFRKMVSWRLKNEVDTLLQQGRPEIQSYFPAGVLEGVDHDGDPIHLERTGVADTSAILRHFGYDAMYEHAIWLREAQSNADTEWQKNYERTQGHKVKQFTIIMDMAGLSRKNMSPILLTLGQEVSRMVQDNYSGFTKRIIFLRSPAIFRFAFNTFKPFIDDNMKERIVFANGDNYCDELEKYLDTSVLPKEVCPENGQGQSVHEFNTRWEGGPMQ